MTLSCRLSSLLVSIQHCRPCRPSCKMKSLCVFLDDVYDLHGFNAICGILQHPFFHSSSPREDSSVEPRKCGSIGH